MLSLNCAHAKYGHLHASEFSSHDISFNDYWAFLKTGINLRKLPPAQSRGAVTFSGLRIEGSWRLSHPSHFFLILGGSSPSRYSKETLIQSRKNDKAMGFTLHVPRIMNITMTLFLKRNSAYGFVYVQLCHNIRPSSFQRTYFSTLFSGENSAKTSHLQMVKPLNL